MGVDSYQRASELMDQGLKAVSRGDWARAREFFRNSAEKVPTADALTYWGWMEHCLGNTSLAIDLCKHAVVVDPDFGNPYNDIGSYLMALGRLDEAIPWFKQAIQAKRYEPRQYPHLNLGRIFVAKQMPVKALREFERAAEIAPGDRQIREAIEEIRRMMN